MLAFIEIVLWNHGVFFQRYRRIYILNKSFFQTNILVDCLEKQGLSKTNIRMYFYPTPPRIKRGLFYMRCLSLLPMLAKETDIFLLGTLTIITLDNFHRKGYTFHYQAQTRA